MTKVYLVFAQGCNPNGTLNVKSRKYVARVFTNKKLAHKYANYMNQEWNRAMGRNADFVKEEIDFYFVDTREICYRDYSILPF